jgi:C4-type Zn-finger protein
MDAICPNCGGELVDYRTDRQSTGGREVILSWTMCSRCRHVGLKKWMVAHAENPHRLARARPDADDVFHRRNA